jgi:hypothetical protein
MIDRGLEFYQCQGNQALIELALILEGRLSLSSEKRVLKELRHARVLYQKPYIGDWLTK